MSFYLLPQVSFQTQQKFQKQIENKQKDLQKTKSHVQSHSSSRSPSINISRKNSVFSNDSVSSNDSIFSTQNKAESEASDLYELCEADELELHKTNTTQTTNTTFSKKPSLITRKISNRLNLSKMNSNANSTLSSSKNKTKAYDYGCHDTINELVQMNKKLEKEKRKLNNYDYSIYDLYEGNSTSSLNLTRTISSASSIFSTAKPLKASFFRKNKNQSHESNLSEMTSSSTLSAGNKFEKYEPIVNTETIIDQINKINKELNSPLIQLQDEISFRIFFGKNDAYNELLINLTSLTNLIFEKDFNNLKLDLVKNDDIRNNYLSIDLTNFDNIHSKLESFDKILNFNGLDFMVDICCKK